MKIVELSCPRCGAPVDASEGRALTCRYCGASLVAQPLEKSQPARTRETFVVLLGRVGPSNRARVAKLLAEHANLTEHEATSLVARAPCELVTYDEPSSAARLAHQIEEAGASAEVETRIVEIPAPPILPDRDVLLEDVGPSKVSVMKVLREHLSVDLGEAKQLVDGAPGVVVERLEGTLAIALRDALEAAGARAATKG
jgi:ribosomal protein L7/L12